ncbi:hypothetical protein [Croceivirga sp. JEA036]|uniref:hypothetical protein n=1 Tax=Croceivirga sp. JEA036 TaxID=2721162 RepID=UPI001ADC2B67|nr:hypothetical protein [Croceivirga sp. JEA036]
MSKIDLDQILYKSFWYSKVNKIDTKNVIPNYFTATPNIGAGIGHQMANWIAGYWFAEQFGLQFAHTPFSNEKWEQFLGFGQQEVAVQDLVKRGYKIVRIPLFDENNKNEVVRAKKIFKAFNGKKVIFKAEQDQFYQAQFGVLSALQTKFYANPIRKTEELKYDATYYNIAIHVRRGDITIGQLNGNSNLVMRWLDNDYFINALQSALSYIKTDKPVKVYLFSQGEKEDFEEFNKIENLVYCLDMGAQETFLHMVRADALITSKSSFSYKPALLNKGTKFCPANFWHGYPKTKDWILLDDKGFLKN